MIGSQKDYSQFGLTSLFKQNKQNENSSNSNNLSSNNHDQNHLIKSIKRSDSLVFKSLYRPDSVLVQGNNNLQTQNKDHQQVAQFSINVNNERQTTLLNEVKEILIKLFANEKIDQNKQYNLTNIQLKIIETFLKKKINKKKHYKIQQYLDKNINIPYLQLFLEENMQNKKPEQYAKYIILKFLKYLKKKIKNDKNKKQRIKKQTIDNRFLKYYFKETSQKNKIPINFFQDPYLKKNKHPKDKCFIVNIKYIGRILLSKIVREELQHFLLKEIQQISRQDINIKLDIIFERLSKKTFFYCLRKQFEQDILRPSFKLPWNYFEVVKSIKTIQEYIIKSKNLDSYY